MRREIFAAHAFFAMVSINGVIYADAAHIDYDDIYWFG
jgi:hypothetical protein